MTKILKMISFYYFLINLEMEYTKKLILMMQMIYHLPKILKIRNSIHHMKKKQSKKTNLLKLIVEKMVIVDIWYSVINRVMSQLISFIRYLK